MKGKQRMQTTESEYLDQIITASGHTGKEKIERVRSIRWRPEEIEDFPEGFKHSELSSAFMLPSVSTYPRHLVYQLERVRRCYYGYLGSQVRLFYV